MNKFWGLFKREHLLHSSNSYSMLVVLLFSLVFLPIGIEYYDNNYDAETTRVYVVFGSVMVLVGYAIFMTIGSINKDVKIKDIWLPNSQSIYRLVGAKVIYQLAVMLILSTVNFIALFFADDILEGTATQFLTLFVFYFYLMLVVFAIFTVVGIVFNSFLKQLSLWIGKLSYIVGVVILFFILQSLDYFLPSLKFLQIGHVSLSKLNEYLPTFNDSSIYLDGLIDLYIVEEVFFTGFFVLLYVIGCKWLERVITR
jgi:hypothetical protein